VQTGGEEMIERSKEAKKDWVEIEIDVMDNKKMWNGATAVWLI
jgi:hypothetical protein